MKALVTGGAGFIGSHLSERLLANGAEVVALDCFTNYYPREIKERNLSTLRGRDRYRFVEGAIASHDLAQLLDGVTHVFHLAAQAGVRKSWGRDFRIYTELNVDATQILLEACVGRSIERFVFASSSSVYGDEVALPMREDAVPRPVSPYGVTKLAAEHLCQLYYVNHRVPTVSLRYFTVYGPRQRPDMGFNRFFRALLDGRPVTQYGDGRQTRDFTFVADAVTATVAAAVRGTPGGVYNIGGGSRLSLLEVFGLIGRVSGRPVTIDHQPSQKGDMRDTYADTSRAREDLGFVASVTIEEGLRQMFVWMETTRNMMHRGFFLLLVAGLALAAACASNPSAVPPGTAQADQFLFERGQAELKEKHWTTAREFFRQIVDNYPQSPFRPDAKLAVGDTYIGDHTTEALVLAANEFREFLTFYPTNPRADYAQYRLAFAYAEQMLAPDRDQSATRDVIKELQTFFDRYPNSALLPEARKLMRDAKDRLSTASYRVGLHYYRVKWYPGAIDRFREVLTTDPEYTNRDAVYFYLAESLVKSAKPAEALPYYERLIKEFEQSEYLQDAHKRVNELKTPAPASIL
jgi:outer membrane assembly lipoprotein YfiO